MTESEPVSTLAFSFILVYMYNIILSHMQVFYYKKLDVYAKKYNSCSRKEVTGTAYTPSFCLAYCIMGQLS